MSNIQFDYLIMLLVKKLQAKYPKVEYNVDVFFQLYHVWKENQQELFEKVLSLEENVCEKESAVLS